MKIVITDLTNWKKKGKIITGKKMKRMNRLTNAKKIKNIINEMA